MTRARWTIFAVVLVILLAVAVVYRQSLVLRIASMRPFVEDRFDGWVRAGADEAELDAAFRRVYSPVGSGPGSWVYELSRPAAEHPRIPRRGGSSSRRGPPANSRILQEPKEPGNRAECARRSPEFHSYRKASRHT